MKMRVEVEEKEFLERPPGGKLLLVRSELARCDENDFIARPDCLRPPALPPCRPANRISPAARAARSYPYPAMPVLAHLKSRCGSRDCPTSAASKRIGACSAHWRRTPYHAHRAQTEAAFPRSATLRLEQYQRLKGILDMLQDVMGQHDRKLPSGKLRQARNEFDPLRLWQISADAGAWIIPRAGRHISGCAPDSALFQPRIRKQNPFHR